MISTTSRKSSSGLHRLESLHEGDSEVEKMATKIERRRERRIEITFPVRVQMATECREIAIRKGYDNVNKITREDLVAIRQRVASEVVQEQRNPFQLIWLLKMVGAKSTQQHMLEVLDRALEHVDFVEESWFHYVDFGFYHTKVVNQFWWMRNETANALLVVILFFACTPILFCQILGDESVCNQSSSSSSTAGTKTSWLQGFYFASVTLSTVGYGDISVSPENVIPGTLYMIVGICVSILSFSAAADDAFGPFASVYEKYFAIDERQVDDFDDDDDEAIWKKIERIKVLKLAEIATHFVLLNAIGVIASRFFQGNLSKVEENEQWTWGESIYWAVQSTTTVGYGDITMSREMQLFQVFYLSLGK